MAVTPVRTGPFPTTSLPSPEMSVVWPTSTPLTSVMALFGPGVPSNGTPRSRARGLDWAYAESCAESVRASATRTMRLARYRNMNGLRARTPALEHTEVELSGAGNYECLAVGCREGMAETKQGSAEGLPCRRSV